MKKAEMSMTTIIGAVIAIIILVIIIFLVTRGSDGVKNSTACNLKGGICTNHCPFDEVIDTGVSCKGEGIKPICCPPQFAGEN